MRRKLAHLLRRVARVMIRWSNKLDAPVVSNEHGVNGMISAGIYRARSHGMG